MKIRVKATPRVLCSVVNCMATATRDVAFQCGEWPVEAGCCDTHARLIVLAASRVDRPEAEKLEPR